MPSLSERTTPQLPHPLQKEKMSKAGGDKSIGNYSKANFNYAN